MVELTAAILAGGLGTRLRSVVKDRPKVLAEVHERPFLTYLLDQLTAFDVKDIVICTGYLGEQVRSTFGDTYGDLRLYYSKEPLPLGTAGALRLALPLFKSDSLLVMNGDSFFDINLNSFWHWHCSHRANATIGLANMNDTRRYGRIHLDADGVVVSFEEKSANAAPGWINGGIYLAARTLLLTIPENRAVSLEQEVFPVWIGKGFYGYKSEGRFLDIGTPKAYAEAEHFFAPQTVL